MRPEDEGDTSPEDQPLEGEGPRLLAAERPDPDAPALEELPDEVRDGDVSEGEDDPVRAVSRGGPPLVDLNETNRADGAPVGEKED